MAGERAAPPGGTARARRRLARMADLLEGEFGVPRRRRSDDLVGGLVRTILSQNTTDTNSRRAYESLRERFPGGWIGNAPGLSRVVLIYGAFVLSIVMSALALLDGGLRLSTFCSRPIPPAIETNVLILPAQL